MLTRNVLLLFVTVSAIGCSQTTAIGTKSEAEICLAWGDTLPTRSRSDTLQTQAEVGDNRAAFRAACPSVDEALLTP